jgi:hypothetical protein
MCLNEHAQVRMFFYCISRAVAQDFFRTQPLSIVCPRIRVLRRASTGQVEMTAMWYANIVSESLRDWVICFARCY